MHNSDADNHHTESPSHDSAQRIDVDRRDAGLRAFQRNDFVSAAALLEPCAEAGDARSQALMARMYYAGNGITQSREKYLYWLSKAASNGDKSAHVRLKRARKQNREELLQKELSTTQASPTEIDSQR